MAANPRPAGRPGRAQKQSKTDLRQQKRKRDLDDLQQLEDAISELVSPIRLAETRRKDLIRLTLIVFFFFFKCIGS